MAKGGVQDQNSLEQKILGEIAVDRVRRPKTDSIKLNIVNIAAELNRHCFLIELDTIIGV